MSDLIKTLLLIVLPFLLLIGAILYRNNKSYSSEPSVDNVIPKNDTIYIIGLGKYQESDLEFASKTIKDFYGYPCKIMGEVKTTKAMYVNKGKGLDDMATLSNLWTDNVVSDITFNKTTLYITDEILSQGNMDLRGSSYISYKNAIVRGGRSFMKSTIIHEMGHLLGLNHCDDLTCVMAINNDEYDTGDFCVKCKKIINYPNI